MHCTKHITDDLIWIGGNDRRLALFEGVYPIPHGVSYNSYVLMDEKTVLMDTVDSSASGIFFENLEHVLADLQDELKATKRQRIRDIMKHPEREDILEETYDELEADLMKRIESVRSSSLTFAPEAGTQRLRDVINKNITEDDPGVSYWTKQSTANCSENRTCSCNVQQLDQKYFPCWHWNVIHTIVHRETRSFSFRIHAKSFFYKTTIYKIA